MPYTSVAIDMARIKDQESFHAVFSEAFGFPDFYGRNMDAWVDCLSSLDDPEDGLTTVHAPSGGVLLLALLNVRDFAARCPGIYADVIEGVAFINYRNVQIGDQPVLCLSFFD